MNARQKVKQLKKQNKDLLEMIIRPGVVLKIPMKTFREEIKKFRAVIMFPYADIEVDIDIRNALAHKIADRIKDELILQKEFTEVGVKYSTDIYIGFGGDPGAEGRD